MGGLSLALAAAKLTLVGSGHMFITTPMVASLIWPFVLKVLLSVRPIHQVFNNTIYASRLFFFQMGQITFNSDDDDDDRRPVGLSGRSAARWRRAVRLVNQRLVLARNSQMDEDDEESLRAFSVLAL